MANYEIDEIRRIRREISARFDHDVDKLIVEKNRRAEIADDNYNVNCRVQKPRSSETVPSDNANRNVLQARKNRKCQLSNLIGDCENCAPTENVVDKPTEAISQSEPELETEQVRLGLETETPEPARPEWHNDDYYSAEAIRERMIAAKQVLQETNNARA